MIRFLPLALLLACGMPPPKTEVQLELGTASAGGAGFEAMPEAATLVPGAQGGFHVWLSYRITGGDEGTVKASHTVRRASDSKLLSKGERKLERGAAGEDGWWQSDVATPAFMCPTPLGVSVIDVQANFEVSLTDTEGNLLTTGSASTKLTCPTDDQAQFCQRICAG